MFGPSKTYALTKTGLATAAIATQYLIVKFGADENHISQAAGATDALIGVIQHAATAAEQEVEVQLNGISNVKAGGVIALGAPVTADAAGKAVTATTGQNILGYACKAAAAGDIIPVLIHITLYTSAAGVGNQVKSVAVAVFDPSATAGMRTIAKHGLGVIIPDNSIITRAEYEVLTTFTSGTDAGTIALGIDTQAEAGILGAIAISNGGNPWDAGVPKASLIDGTTAAYVKTTAAREICATVAVEVLTAGKMLIFVEYMPSL